MTADFTDAEVTSLVASIDAISGDDPDGAHSELDDLLVAEMPEEIQAAIGRLHRRCRWWATA